MKKIALSFLLILTSSTLLAIDKGEYLCEGRWDKTFHVNGKGVFYREYASFMLTLNHAKFKTTGSMNMHGTWEDYGDEAIFEYRTYSIVGANMFGFGGEHIPDIGTITVKKHPRDNLDFRFVGVDCRKYTKALQKQLKREEKARRAEEKRVEEKWKKEQAKRARLAEQKRIKDEKIRLAEQKRIKAEQARLAEQKRIKAEQARLKKVQEDRAKLKEFTDAGISKKDALFFMEEGISFTQARKMSKNKKSTVKKQEPAKINSNDNWKESGFKTKDAQYYIKTKTSISEAKKWKQAGFRAQDAFYYINKNITLAEAIARQK